MLRPTERASFPWRTCGTPPAKNIKRSGKNGPRLYQPLSERRRRDHADTRPTDEERLGTGQPCDHVVQQQHMPSGRAPVVQRQSWSEQLGDVGEPFLCARYFAGLMVDAQGIEPWTSPV